MRGRRKVERTVAGGGTSADTVDVRCAGPVATCGFQVSHASRGCMESGKEEGRRTESEVDDDVVRTEVLRDAAL